MSWALAMPRTKMATHDERPSGAGFSPDCYREDTEKAGRRADVGAFPAACDARATDWW